MDVNKNMLVGCSYSPEKVGNGVKRENRWPPWEKSFQKEDMVHSVRYFREGLSDQDWTKHDRFGNRDEGDQHSESWVMELWEWKPD